MKKVLITGGRGFIGSAVMQELAGKYDVYSTCVEPNTIKNEIQADLLNADKVQDVLSLVRPDIIVNCAGIVTNDEKASFNEFFTKNILHSVKNINLNLQLMVILGSAGEYGEVNPASLPVDEDAPLTATSMYGTSKVRETTYARVYSKDNNIPLVVARLFNPIGPNMPPRMLISGLKRQAIEIQNGDRRFIEVSRLDSKRDYIDVRDVAKAIGCLLSKSPFYDIYNIGTGLSTTTNELVEFVLAASGLRIDTPIIETSTSSEIPIASRANIDRIKKEYNWAPERTPETVIKELFNGIN